MLLMCFVLELPGLVNKLRACTKQPALMSPHRKMPSQETMTVKPTTSAAVSTSLQVQSANDETVRPYLYLVHFLVHVNVQHISTIDYSHKCGSSGFDDVLCNL